MRSATSAKFTRPAAIATCRVDAAVAGAGVPGVSDACGVTGEAGGCAEETNSARGAIDPGARKASKPAQPETMRPIKKAVIAVNAIVTRAKGRDILATSWQLEVKL